MDTCHLFDLPSTLSFQEPPTCLPRSAGGKSWDPAQDKCAASRHAARCMRLERNQSDPFSKTGGESEQEDLSLSLELLVLRKTCLGAHLALKRTKPGTPGGSVS